MKAILEFNLPENQNEFDMALKGSDWHHICWDLDNYLRTEIKYNDELSDVQRFELQKVRDKLYDLMNRNNLQLC